MQASFNTHSDFPMEKTEPQKIELYTCSFLNLAKLYSFVTLTVLSSISVLQYRSIKFLKFEHDQRIIYVQNVFLYFEYDDFLT